MESKNRLLEQFGNIDIYLFDQLLKGRFDECKTVLDAGCGSGRNIVYFLKNKVNVYAIDENAEALQQAMQLSIELAPGNSLSNFQLTSVEEAPFKDAYFDLIISSAVLHFARDHGHFKSMLFSMWRMLKPGGFLFVRLASSIGIEAGVSARGNGRFLLPDGSERYLVSEKDLHDYTDMLEAQLYEPVKLPMCKICAV